MASNTRQMSLIEQGPAGGLAVERRQFERRAVQCHARILIGTRQYAGYLQNISRGGAMFRTITPIRQPGEVVLRLPDLPPLRCQLRWSETHAAGVSFELALSGAQFSQWVANRPARMMLRLVGGTEAEKALRRLSAAERGGLQERA
jgi:hypothetical protein